MNENDIRSHLAEVRTALKKNNEEREVLLSLQKGYEGWLRLNGPQQMALPTDVPVSRSPVQRGKKAPSFRGSVLKILRDAHGEPLHAKEILRGVLAAGAKTAGKDPLALTDLQCYSIMKTEPIEKVAPRTWRWKGT